MEISKIVDETPFSFPKALFVVLTYFYFFGVFLVLIGFQLNLSYYFPKYLGNGTPFFSSVDFGGSGSSICVDKSILVRIIFNAIGLGIFAIHHSTFARTFVKRFLINTLKIPADIERSLFVLVASILANLSIYHWCVFPESQPLWGGPLKTTGGVEVGSYLGSNAGVLIGSALFFYQPL